MVFFTLKSEFSSYTPFLPVGGLFWDFPLLNTVEMKKEGFQQVLSPIKTLEGVVGDIKSRDGGAKMFRKKKGAIKVTECKEVFHPECWVKSSANVPKNHRRID